MFFFLSLIAAVGAIACALLRLNGPMWALAVAAVMLQFVGGVGGKSHFSEKLCGSGRTMWEC